MNLHDALHQIAPALSLDAAALIGFAEEDTIGGYHADPALRKWQAGSIWAGEGQFVYALIRALRPARVVDYSVGSPATAAHIQAALDANGNGELRGGAWFDTHPGEPFDLFIEDASHTHEQTADLVSRARQSGARLILSHDAGHRTVGVTVASGFTAALGECPVLMIDDSDCGWGYWVNPAAAFVAPFVEPRLGKGWKRELLTQWPIKGEDDKPKVLYLPIIEPGRFHDVALANKRGLFDALVAYGCQVIQLDYLAAPPGDLYAKVVDAIDRAGITLLLTQFHSAEHLTPADLAALREHKPNLRIVNWSGDSWRHSLVSEPMLALAEQCDLWLVAAPDVLPVYAENGVNAAYWQIAYEKPVGDLPDMPTYDVVFLANVITDERRRLMEFLRSLDGVSVGIYGDWEHADGTCQYDFGAGEALYKNAKIAIADNVYPDQQNYVSNRPIQALVAGGALLLHQHVPKMQELLGIEPGAHYVEWFDFETLEKHIRTYLKRGNEPRRRKMVRAGQEYALAFHTYAQRVEQLFTELLPGVSRA